MAIPTVLFSVKQVAAVSATDVIISPFAGQPASVNTPTSYSLQVSGVNAAETALSTPSAWDVFLEGSLDNIGWTTVLEHVNGMNVNGVTVSQPTTQPNKQPFLYFRIRVHVYTKSAEDHLKITAVGVMS